MIIKNIKLTLILNELLKLSISWVRDRAATILNKGSMNKIILDCRKY